jgi:hypothetical protein
MFNNKRNEIRTEKLDWNSSHSEGGGTISSLYIHESSVIPRLHSLASALLAESRLTRHIRLAQRMVQKRCFRVQLNCLFFSPDRKCHKGIPIPKKMLTWEV